ncbi:TetR family transcriptional regulator [Gordonia jinghuaiqii]|uniref:TetR/AcrR family transcriptional regulator n=1 Tax=Gordonia jinghuaiqii TaxID=2758710 RepID=A0A7D7RS42_9ACTN|nr:TetR family transcriptional regulator [Gordonia jinghuaiqii]QMT02773.1 TetR/AcrR family transcriptional regulator [Gordonia jinghuaiqii]
MYQCDKQRNLVSSVPLSDPGHADFSIFCDHGSAGRDHVTCEGVHVPTFQASSTAQLSSSLIERAFLASTTPSDAAPDPTAEKLLDAAFDLFSRLGVQRTPMEKVAKRAGVTRVTLYRKFATKDALVDEVVLREFRRYFDRFRSEIPNADSVAERVVVGFVGSLRAISGNPLIGGINGEEPSMLIESMIGGDGLLLAVVQQFVSVQLRREQLAGNISDELDVELVAEMMVRISASFLTVPSRVVDITDDAQLAEVARQFLVPMLNTPR